MSIRAWYDVWCDDEACIEWTPGGDTRTEAAKAAKESGWKLVRGKWLCPEHQPGRPSPSGSGAQR